MSSSDAAAFARSAALPRARQAATPRCTLEFVLAVDDAVRARQALAATRGCAIASCVPHPTERFVSLLIECESASVHEVMQALMSTVPGGQFGRVSPCQAAWH